MTRVETVVGAVVAGDHARVRELVAADPALARARDEQGVSVLLLARYRGDATLVEHLAEAVSDLDIFEAAALGRSERVADLVARHPSLRGARSADGFTPLHLAAFFGGIDAVRTLLDAGADPNARGTGWMTGTPLHSAVAARDAGVVRALLQAGAEPNVAQEGGWTPLHGAARHDDLPIVRALVDAGADPRARADDGRTPLDMASDDATRAVLEEATG